MRYYLNEWRDTSDSSRRVVDEVKSQKSTNHSLDIDTALLDGIERYLLKDKKKWQYVQTFVVDTESRLCVFMHLPEEMYGKALRGKR